MALLDIYDATDSNIVETATNRTVSGSRTMLPINNFNTDFIKGLNNLVTSNATFDKILFETHGSPGLIAFGNVGINATWVGTTLANHLYEQLCPTYTRIYFNGCNVAADSVGWQFLTAFGSIFLKTAGGETFGHTSLGLVVPLYSWLTGHVVHVTGDERTVYFAPGGSVLERFEQGDV